MTSEYPAPEPRPGAAAPAPESGPPPSAGGAPAFLNGAALALVVLLLAAGGPWLIGQFRSLPRYGALDARSDQRVVTLEVGGMTCEGCVGKVEGELGAVAGVAEVDVRLAQRRAYIVCDKAVADSALLGAVGRAGPGFMAAVVGK